MQLQPGICLRGGPIHKYECVVKHDMLLMVLEVPCGAHAVKTPASHPLEVCLPPIRAAPDWPSWMVTGH